MRVVLIMPDYQNYYPYGPEKLIIFSPLGLEYIAAYIQDIADTKIIDNRFVNLKDIEAEITRFQPDYVGISCNLSSQIYHVNNIAKIAKKNGSITVVGGWHPTLVPGETLASPWIDITVRSEGELTFQELIQNNDPKGVSGLSYKLNGRIIHNPNRELMDLNQLSLPERNLRSQSVNSRYHFCGIPCECMETSRGCPFRCKFCSIHVFYRRKYRHRAIPHIMNELRWLQKRSRYVYIIDDNFVVNTKHILRLCEAIIQESLNMFFMTTSRVDTVSKNPKIFEKMAEAGFFHIFLGIESFSNRTLQSLKKRFQFKEIKTAIKILHDLGFIIQGNIILGADFNETEQDLESTIEIAKSLDLDIPSFSILTPYPGTELMEEVVKNNLLLTREWRDFNWFTPTIKYLHLTSEQLKDYLHKAYTEVPLFKNPTNRFKRMLLARGLSFFLSRFCNLFSFKSFFNGFKNLTSYYKTNRS